MRLTISRTIKISPYRIGCLLAYAYIFTAYIAQDLIISSGVNSICLYAFLLVSAYLFVQEFSARGAISAFSGWYLAFFGVSLLMSLYSPDFKQVVDSFYAMFVTFCISFFLQLYVKDEAGFYKISWCYAISAFVFVVLLFATGNLNADGENRLGQDLFENVNIFAMMMMIATMYTMWLLVYKAKNGFEKILILAMVIADVYALMLIGGRKFFVIPFVFLYILFLFKTDKRGKRKIFIYTALFAVLIVVLWQLIMNVEVLYDTIGIRMEGLLESFKGEKGDSSTEIRKVIRTLAFDKWKESPIWGYGFDSFKFLAKETVGHFYYSHCNYTELLYCGGIIYFLVYYWVFYKILSLALKNKQIPNGHKAFAIAAVISLFVFDYGGVTYNSTPTMIMLMMAFKASTFVTVREDTYEQITDAGQASEK